MDVPDRFDDAPKFNGPHDGAGQQGRKEKMISRTDEGYVESGNMKLL